MFAICSSQELVKSVQHKHYEFRKLRQTVAWFVTWRRDIQT